MTPTEALALGLGGSGTERADSGHRGEPVDRRGETSTRMLRPPQVIPLGQRQRQEVRVILARSSKVGLVLTTAEIAY